MKFKLLLLLLLLTALWTPAWAGQELVGKELERDFSLSELNLAEIAAQAKPLNLKLDAPFGVSETPSCPPSPYRTWEETDTTAYPHSAIGRLFVKQDSQWYVCSASLVEPDLILTAGHCVVYNGAWSTQMVFVPGYRNDSAPFGLHYGKYLWAWASWINYSDFRFDYAMVKLHSTPGHTTGWLGTAWSEGYYHTWQQAGYPGEPTYDGYRLWYNESAFGAANDSVGEPKPIWVGSSFTSGSSGGPWIISKEDGLKVNSVVSAGYAFCDQMVQGPYFDANFPRMLDTAKAQK